MCWACDNPGGDRLEYMHDLMVRHGWAVQGVERDGDRPPWGYTVGLTECGLPELVVTGMPMERCAALLNDVAWHLLHAELPRPGELMPLRGWPTVEIVELPNPDAHLFTAAEFFGPRLRALQLVWADDRGHWPWDRGFRGVRGGQPVLGPRAVRPSRPGAP